jgi:hypothetical protein
MVVSLTQSGGFHIFRQPFSYRLDQDVIFSSDAFPWPCDRAQAKLKREVL